MALRLPALLKRETIEAVDGTEISLQPQISQFWSELTGLGFSPRLIDRVWAANRCIQLNSQQIAAMPMKFFGNYEPAWVSNPDPVWYPNGIGEAVAAAVRSYYGWGDAFLYITARYANGFPSAWTVLMPETVNVQNVRGRRAYKVNEQPIDPADVVQITRDPRGDLRGTSVFRSYAPLMWASIAGAELNQSMLSGGAVPNAVIKSARKLTAEQAAALQEQWVDATALRRGAPAILPPELDFQQLAFSPKDLLLLDAQEFDARVIASACGVPPFLLNLPLVGGLTYQNPEMLVDQWWRVELRPAARRIADALSTNMLPRGSWVEFESREMLAPSFKDQVDAWLALLKEQAVTVDEVRAAVLRLGSIDSDDALEELTVPTMAAASPADAPSATVQQLRPAQGVIA